MLVSATPLMTVWLSVLLGAYLLAGGIGILMRGDRWTEMIADFERSPGLVMIAGAIAFAVGAAIVSLHNVWSDPAAIIVSAVGWMALVEGLVLIAAPDLWLRFARPIMRYSRIWGVIMLVLGAFLLSAAIAWPLAPSL